jgi:hypothetical protein
VFIRAPVIERVGPDVDVLARLDDGRVVAVRHRNVLAIAFHPELAGETRFHRLLATMAGAFHEPNEGSGRRRHPVRRSLPRSGELAGTPRSEGSGSPGGAADAPGTGPVEPPGGWSGR